MGQCSLAIGDGHFATQLLERAEPGEMRAISECLQVQRRREVAVHNRLALRAGEPQFVTGTADLCRVVGASAASGGTGTQSLTRRTAADPQA
jgi:hypothetical protein